MGFELELYARQQDRSDAVNEFRQHLTFNGKPCAIFKEDGSLSDSYGAELVVCPMPLDRLTTYVNKIQPSLREYWSGWDRSNYGCHISYSKRGLSHLHIAKILTFWHSKSIRKPLVALTGRAQLDLNRWARIGDCGPYYGLDHIRKVSSEKYVAVNVKHSTHIEFRVFQSTTKAERLLAYLEFCHASVQWARDSSMLDLQNISLFNKHLQNHKKDYKHLLPYWDKALNAGTDQDIFEQTPFEAPELVQAEASDAVNNSQPISE